MSEHTKEKWRVELRNYKLSDTGDYEGVVEIRAGDRKRPIIEIFDESDEMEANACRIVACVNACAGLSNEMLDNICMISGSIAGRFAEQRDYASQLENRLYHLLSAAKNLRDVKGRHHSEIAMNRLIDAIAEVESGNG